MKLLWLLAQHNLHYKLAFQWLTEIVRQETNNNKYYRSINVNKQLRISYEVIIKMIKQPLPVIQNQDGILQGFKGQDFHPFCANFWNNSWNEEVCLGVNGGSSFESISIFEVLDESLHFLLPIDASSDQFDLLNFELSGGQLCFFCMDFLLEHIFII